MNKPHKHAELIKAWADGAEIEWRTANAWLPADIPSWSPSTEYRVKPQPHKWQKEMDAYAAGKKIQWRQTSATTSARFWNDIDRPGFHTGPAHEYRIKPEPAVHHMRIEVTKSGSHVMWGSMMKEDNLKLTFEDGVLVNAEVL